MMSKSITFNTLLLNAIAIAMLCAESSLAFSPSIVRSTSQKFYTRTTAASTSTALFASTEKVAREVNGEELEIMLTDWDQPLLVDAYATWCGPCLLMAPEFEAAAKELEGKVRFVKLDTDKEPDMAGRLNVMGLPTLLFLDKFQPEEGSDGDDEGPAKAVLKERIEGAIRKDSILDLCNYHFFGGPRPEQL